MFNLRMNPASEGDALVLSWGEPRELHHAIIDLGRIKDYRANRDYYRTLDRLELLVVTHIDADHIEGAMPMVAEMGAPVVPGDVWYNGYHHLTAARDRLARPDRREPLGAVQGEKLSAGIMRFAWPWNQEFESGIVSRGSAESGSIVLPGGLRIMLVSPDDGSLAALIPRWERELEKSGLRPLDPDRSLDEPGTDRERLSTLNVEALAARPFKEDTAAPNGSSIAFIAEFDGSRVLLGADAHPGVMAAAIRTMGYSETNRCRLACHKISHHGSKANTSPELLGLLDCTRFAFSTDGTRHDHPDPELIARVLVSDPDREKILFFNFRQPNADIWDNPELMARYHYRCVFPDDGGSGVDIALA